MKKKDAFNDAFYKFQTHFEEFQKLDLRQRKEYKTRKFQEILKYALERSDFYKKTYKDIDISKLESPQGCPIITKQDLCNNFESIVVPDEIKIEKLKEYFNEPFNFEKKYLNEYLAFHTSGSTGIPTYLVWGDEEFAISTANFYFRLASSISKIDSKNFEENKKYKVAYIGILDDYIGGNSWAYAMKSYVDMRMYSVFSKIEFLCEELNEFQPNVIMTKPSLLGILARKQKEGVLSIELDKIIFAGEMISPIDYNDIEKNFHVKPSNSYSTCETGPIAFQMNNDIECLNIFDDLVWLELIDDNGNTINEPYKLGNVVITNLYNKTMPLIRYNLFDRAFYLPSECPGEFNKISFIKGRGTSFFTFKGKNGEKIKICEYPFWSLYVVGIIRYQVVQEDYNSLVVRIQWENDCATEKAQKKLREKIERILNDYEPLKNNVKISFENVDIISPGKTGKIQITFPLKDKN